MGKWGGGEGKKPSEKKGASSQRRIHAHAGSPSSLAHFSALGGLKDSEVG